MTEDEKLVRETWDKAYKYQSLSGREMVQFGPHALDDWEEAADFTRQRLQEIAEMEEEIAVAEDQIEYLRLMRADPQEMGVCVRLKKRLTDWRDEKKRGMR